MTEPAADLPPIDDDVQTLHRLGYTQELLRRTALRYRTV